MRVRSYFLIAGAGVLCLVGAFVGYTSVQSWLWSRGRPLFGAEFPNIAQRETLRIQLRRSFCFGTCPDYVVQINGDGTVQYDGRMFVAVPGKHRMHIPVAKVDALLAQFKDARFFATYDQYGLVKLDAPFYTMTISFDGRQKTVEDHGGNGGSYRKKLRN